MDIAEIKFQTVVPTGIAGNTLRASQLKDYFTDVGHSITLEKGEIVVTRRQEGATPVRVPYHNVVWYTRKEAEK